MDSKERILPEARPRLLLPCQHRQLLSVSRVVVYSNQELQVVSTYYSVDNGMSNHVLIWKIFHWNMTISGVRQTGTCPS